MVLERPSVEGRPQDGQTFLQAVPPLGQRYAETGELDGSVAETDPEAQAPRGQGVHREGVLGQADRMLQGQDGEAGADAHPFGPHRQGGGQREGRRGVAVLGQVVLGYPHRADAQLAFGQGHLVDDRAVELAPGPAPPDRVPEVVVETDGGQRHVLCVANDHHGPPRALKV